jgi:LuxR family maltose regulon positive regulatory protein
MLDIIFLVVNQMHSLFAGPFSGGIASRRGLLERLESAGRVTVVSAPAGSGKTVLLRSWISAAGLAGLTARVPVQDGGRDE